MKFKVLHRERLFQQFFRVDRVQLEVDTFAGGKLQMQRFHLQRPEVVALVLENIDRGTLVFVRQFRYSATLKGADLGWTTEIVGGLIDPGESPYTCALREAQEETGYAPKQAQFWTSFFATIGISDELIHLYHAQVTDADKAHLGGGLAHEGEDIEVIELPLEEAMDQVARGIITDSKTMIAIQWLALKKAGITAFSQQQAQFQGQFDPVNLPRLKEAQLLMLQGKSLDEAATQIGIPPQTLLLWQHQFRDFSG